MKKYLNEINNYEEFKNVVMNSEELKDLCIKYCEDNAYFWIGEVLDDVPKFIEYSISGYNDYMYINARQKDNWKVYIELCEWFNGIDSEFAVFHRSINNDIERLERYATALCDDDYGCIYIKPKDYTYMQKNANHIVDDLLAQVLRYCEDEISYWYDIENCLDDAYQNNAFEDYYIDDDGNLWKQRFDRRVA